MGRRCLVAIDIDGTLIPTLIDFESLRARIRELLGVQHPLRPLAESLADLPVSDELKGEAWRLIEEAELKSVEGLDPGKVAENVASVRRLLSAGAGVVFVTARSSRTAELVLAMLGLSGAAEAVISRDFSPHRVEQLRRVLKLAGGRSVVFVGDTQHDESSAQLVGIRFLKVEDYSKLPEALAKALEECAGTPPQGL